MHQSKYKNKRLCTLSADRDERGAACMQGLAEHEVLLCFLAFALLLLATRATAELARRLGQPEVLGELMGGFLVGPFVMGLYLTVSINRFGTHSNEAFISLAIADWKNFLRLKIDRDGQLTVFPVGLERVPRRWKPTFAGLQSPAYAPDDPEATEPRLIEPPVRVTPRA